jgi:VanZ family protein
LVDSRETVWRRAFAAALVVVLVLALLPPRIPMPSTGWDKVNHVLVFAGLAVLGCRSYAGRAVLVLSGLLAYGGAIELLQSLTGYRTAEWLDLAADGAGASLGWLLTYARARVIRVR